MRVGGQAEEGGDRVPCLAPGLDPTALPLSPREGYLLSRVDGRTPWALLRQIGGLPPEEIDRCLERWLKEGVLELAGRGALGCTDAATQAGQAPPPPEPAGTVDLDPSLDIDLELQKELIALASDRERPYHEVLGVARDADAKTIKRAYFQKSKRYHPDRYFRKKLGPFEPLVELCFKRLLEAYELLSDPATRAEVQRTEASAAGPSLQRLSSAEASKRLRRRLGRLTGPQRAIAERKRKAKSFFESGMSAFREERWLEAAGSVRLAIAFDPHNEAYREAFAGVQRRAHEERAQQLIRQGEAALEMRDYREAFEHFQDAFHYRPFDAELAYRAARLAWQASDDLRAAKELAAAAAELEPERADYRRLLGQIYAAAGLRANARRELEAALRLDPRDKEARRALRGL